MDVARRSALVLFADDDPTFRVLLRRALRGRPGLRTAEAAGGSEAVLLASELEPDMVVLDYDMPRMDGMAAARAMQEKQPGLPILILSAYARGDIPGIDQPPPVRYAQKGTGIAALREEIDGLLDSPPPGSGMFPA